MFGRMVSVRQARVSLLSCISSAHLDLGSHGPPPGARSTLSASDRLVRVHFTGRFTGTGGKGGKMLFPDYVEKSWVPKAAAHIGGHRTRKLVFRDAQNKGPHQQTDDVRILRRRIKCVIACTAGVIRDRPHAFNRVWRPAVVNEFKRSLVTSRRLSNPLYPRAPHIDIYPSTKPPARKQVMRSKIVCTLGAPSCTGLP